MTDQLAAQTLDHFKKGLELFPDHLKSEYIQAVAAIAIAALHGEMGAGFTHGFLAEGIRSLKEPPTIILTRPGTSICTLE
ncbi:MAG: hypothetical protein ACXWTP_03315 [Methylosarcina sp.]